MVLLISRPIIFLFFLISLFSGPGLDDPEVVDISRFRGLPSLLFAFKQAGFANQSIDEYKLLPCSLGTFVNASSKDPKCLECPAGNFFNSYDMRVTYFNHTDSTFRGLSLEEFLLITKHVITVMLAKVSLFS